MNQIAIVTKNLSIAKQATAVRLLVSLGSLLTTITALRLYDRPQFQKKHDRCIDYYRSVRY